MLKKNILILPLYFYYFCVFLCLHKVYTTRANTLNSQFHYSVFCNSYNHEATEQYIISQTLSPPWSICQKRVSQYQAVMGSSKIFCYWIYFAKHYNSLNFFITIQRAIKRYCRTHNTIRKPQSVCMNAASLYAHLCIYSSYCPIMSRLTFQLSLYQLACKTTNSNSITPLSSIQPLRF